jgi:hypothetical protein
LRRNCILRNVIEGKTEGMREVTGRRRKRPKLLADDLKEKGVYWKLQEEALDCTLWGTHFGRFYGPVLIQITK